MAHLRSDAVRAGDPVDRATDDEVAHLIDTLGRFPAPARKMLRIVRYTGTGRLVTEREQVVRAGYAIGFAHAMDHVSSLVPSSEVVERGSRRQVPAYPDIALRELVANALIHQDLFVTGAGPMVEIFSDRVEISNPGEPLVDTARFVDAPPRSRNASLASLMRRIGICEERGSGIDKVVSQTEELLLPAPLFEVTNEFTRSVLFAPRPLNKMDKDDRVRACYLHACLRYVNREYLTNTSVRERFGIERRNLALASRLIEEAVGARVIAPVKPDAGKRFMRYLPSWAIASPPASI